MEKQRKHIDDFFKDELGSYAETPPPASWDALQKKLTAYPPQGKGIAYHWFGYSAMCLLILSLGLSLARKVKTDAGYISSLSTDKSIAITAQPATINNAGATQTTITNNPTQPANQNNNIQTATTTPQEAHETIADNNNLPSQKASAGTTTNNHTTSHKHPHGGSKVSGTLAANISKNKKGTTTPPSNLLNAAYEPASKNSGKPSNENDDATADNTTTVIQSGKNKIEDNKTTTQKKNDKQPADEKPQPPKHRNKPSFNRFEAGIKGGYETGMGGGNTANKYLGSIYLQFNLSPKFSIMTQPAIKYATINKVGLDNPASYYKEHTDSTRIEGSTNTVYGPDLVPLGSITVYHYSQTHDSIVKSNTTGGTYAEYEIPLLLKFKFNESFSVYGGVNMDYSRTPSVVENTYSQKDISVGKDVSVFTPSYGTAAPPATSNVITYDPKSEITNYKGYSDLTTNPTLRLGYMIGVSYDYSDRWLLDVLLQQTRTNSYTQNPNNIDINNPLSATYVRFTIGYKLIK